MRLEYLKFGLEINRYNLKYATPCEAYVIELRSALDGTNWNRVVDMFFSKYDKLGNTKAIPKKPFNSEDMWKDESFHCKAVRDKLLEECEYYLEESNRWKVFDKKY